MADTNNPIKLAYDALWTCLETKAQFTTLFPNGTPHQIRYNTDLLYKPEPDNLGSPAPADYPICRITLAKCLPRLNFCSDGSGLAATFLIEIATGHQMQTRMMNAIWAIYLGLSEWIVVIRNASTGVKWNSRLCIHDVADENVDLTDSDDEANRGTEQWTGIFQVTVSFDFETADLISQDS